MSHESKDKGLREGEGRDIADSGEGIFAERSDFLAGSNWINVIITCCVRTCECVCTNASAFKYFMEKHA